MKRTTAVLIAALTLAGASTALAQPSTPGRLLTGGIVQEVDPISRVIVLDNGHRVRANLVMVDGVHTDISAVKPGTEVMVAGVEIGSARSTALPPAVTR